MDALTALSVSDQLSLGEAVSRLQTSPLVDGIAEFGSRAGRPISPVSDHDLLILVRDLPAPVFQLVTTIDRRLADIVLVPVATADSLLASAEPPNPTSFIGLFARKMLQAHILHDASGRLHRVQVRVTRPETLMPPEPQAPSRDLYSTWFWLSLGLLHLERLSQSDDPTHQAAAAMMLTANLPVAWRGYFAIRGIPWDGEKAAVQYWDDNDLRYRQLVQQCLEVADRPAQLDAYHGLVERTLAPVGRAFTQGETAVVLAQPEQNAADVRRVVQYWNSLLGT